jgi:hypothetical protein
MLRFPLTVAFLFLLATFPAGADQLPVVPNPQGFIESSALSVNIRNGALAGHPASQKLIGIYYPPNTLAKILNTGTSEPSAICTAYIDGEFDSEATADTHFKQLVINAKKDGAQKFDRSDPAIDRILKNFEDAATNLGTDTTITVNGATILGAIAETNTYYAGSMIATYTRSVDGQSAMMPFATAVAWMRIGPRIVKLSATYPFLGKASIIEANDTLMSWLRAVVSSN